MEGRRLRVWAVTLLSVAGAAWVVACGPGYLESVHFNDVPDFGMPPPPVSIGAWEEYTSRPVPKATFLEDGDYEAEWKRQEARQALAKKAAADAREHEAKGNFVAAADAWAIVRTNARPEDAIGDPEAIGREFARDREEVLRQGAPAPTEAFRQYLRLSERLRVKPDDQAAVAEMTKLAEEPGSGFVRPHAAYALAGLAYDQGKWSEAATRYEAVAGMTGPRREPALMMAIRTRLGSRSDWSEAETIPPADLAKGREWIATLLREFPSSRFASSAEGWRIRADYLAGKRVEALNAYLRSLAKTRDPDAQVSLLSSIRKVIESLKPEEAKEFRAGVLAQPELLQPYLDYRLYHTEAKPAELGALASFANEVLAKKPDVRLGSEVEARLAEIAYLCGDAKRALVYAERSLRQPDGGRADLATFVQAAALAKTKVPEPAYEALQGYETKFKDSYLVRPALEQRALLAERLGKWSAAIDDYRALKYDADIAYLLDVRLTPEQVEALAQEKKEPPLQLAAGYRRLRGNDFAAAERWFSGIPDAERRKLAQVGSRDYAWLQPENANSPLDRIPDPLTTARDLAKLSADKSAKGLYALASYYYTRRNLLLYNAALWEGQRGSLGWAWNEKIATREDEAARRRHHYEHECLWRARVICLEIARRYPKDPVAAKALYRAATATRRLANFNPWWRSEDRVDRYAQAADYLRRVYTEFPRDPLAKNARKYEKVFRQEGKGMVASTFFEEAR